MVELEQLAHRRFFADVPFPGEPAAETTDAVGPAMPDSPATGRSVRLSGNGVLVDGEPYARPEHRRCSVSTTASCPSSCEVEGLASDDSGPTGPADAEPGAPERPGDHERAHRRRPVRTEVADWWATVVSPDRARRHRAARASGAGPDRHDQPGRDDLADAARRAAAAGAAALLEAALVAGVDHGPQAPSIAIARMAATCGVGLNSAVASGVNMLGDVHGGAGQQCVELLIEIASGGAGGDIETAPARCSPSGGPLALHPRLRAPVPPGRSAPRPTAVPRGRGGPRRGRPGRLPRGPRASRRRSTAGRRRCR